MKHKLLTALLTVSLFAACSESDNDSNSNSSLPPTVATGNDNCNDTSREPALSRLEFPKVKDVGTRILIKYNNDDFGINYSVEWDTQKRSQRYSCYQMYAANRVSKTSRYYSKDNQYPFDPQLKGAEYYTYDPYWSTGYDHGHICPSADRLYSADANYQTFFLTNMQPQRNAFNTGIWKAMESQLRLWITSKSPSTDTLYVCKGGTIEATDEVPNPLIETLSNGLPVPRYFFMALLRKNSSGYKALGFWVEHINRDLSSDPMSKYVVNIRTLERLTGIDFFCNLPDNIEERVETLPEDQVRHAWGL